MSNTANQNAARGAVQSIKQEINSNGTYRYSVTYADGTNEVVRWRASGNYSHAIVFGDGRISFRSSPAPSIGGSICLTIEKSATVSVEPIATAPMAKTVVQFGPANEPNEKAQSNDDEPMDEYIPQNGEIDDLTMGITCGENVLMTGPTGCGKTHAVHWAAKLINRRVITMQGGDGMTLEHMIGYRDIVREGDASVTVWRDGLITTAMRNGAILYADEPNALPDGIRFFLFSAMDHRRTITLAENNGEVVKARDGFVVVGAMNEGAGYSGTSMMSFAFRRRFGIVIDLEYLPKAREAKLLESRSGADLAICEKLTEIGNSLRVSRARREIKTPIGTASLISCAKLIAKGVSPLRAGNLTILGQIPADLGNERKAVSDVLAAHFTA